MTPALKAALKEAREEVAERSTFDSYGICFCCREHGKLFNTPIFIWRSRHPYMHRSCFWDYIGIPVVLTTALCLIAVIAFRRQEMLIFGASAFIAAGLAAWLGHTIRKVFRFVQ